jgi:hypothetical protein
MFFTVTSRGSGSAVFTITVAVSGKDVFLAVGVETFSRILFSLP